MIHSPDYWTLPPAAVLANVCCMLLVLFSASVAYGASRPSEASTETSATGVEEEQHTVDTMSKETNQKQEGEV